MNAKTLLIGAATLAIISIAAPAGAVVINFDNLGNGVVVTNQYPEATFSSIAGSQVLTTAQALGSSLPNFICSGVNGSINCSDPVYVDFTNPVSNLSFVAVGDNQFGPNATVNVFAGANFLGSVNSVGDNVFLTTYTIDLSAFSGVTRIEIVNVIDPGGLGFDDFTFDVGVINTPEPVAFALFGLGIVGIAAARRRAR